jgi:hypothetical protein
MYLNMTCLRPEGIVNHLFPYTVLKAVHQGTEENREEHRCDGDKSATAVSPDVSPTKF